MPASCKMQRVGAAAPFHKQYDLLTADVSLVLSFDKERSLWMSRYTTLHCRRAKCQPLEISRRREKVALLRSIKVAIATNESLQELQEGLVGKPCRFGYNPYLSACQPLLLFLKQASGSIPKVL